MTDSPAADTAAATDWHGPTLTDGTVTVRPLEHRFAAGVAAAAQDPEIPRFTLLPWPYTVDDAHAFVDVARSSWARVGHGPLLVTDMSEQVLGVIGLVRSEADKAAAEIGYWTGRDARGRGVTTRAVVLLCRYGLDHLGLARVDWAAIVGNHGSRLVAVRAGFSVTGVERHDAFRDGRADFWIGSLLAGEPSPADPSRLTGPAARPVLGQWLQAGRVTLRPVQAGDESLLAEATPSEVLDSLGVHTPLPSHTPVTISPAGLVAYWAADGPWWGELAFAVCPNTTGDAVGLVRVATGGGTGYRVNGSWFSAGVDEPTRAEAVDVAARWAAGAVEPVRW